MSTYRIEQLEVCQREMFGDMVLTCQTPVRGVLPAKIIQPVSYPMSLRRSSADSVVKKSILENEKRRASALVDELLIDIYYNIHNTTTDYNSATSGKSHKNSWVEVANLQEKDVVELMSVINCLRNHIERMGSVLVRQLKRRDALRRQQEAYSDVITKQLAKRAPEETEMRFTIQPAPGESSFSQWVAAMKMVAQLPGGIPPEFRRRLWLTLAERHLASLGVNWPSVERSCFSEWSHPADAELGVQIVKDLHRTGCSLFCGEDGQENQALLKRVLLAYARWNKAVGYCQGFNMLAALILQVTDKCESDALKLMIYLIEGVLPDSYFADSLRGLSVDMAVFRELLRSKLPRLSKHLDTLQNAAKDGNRSYEPPLTNVFTMQWFLTLFCNCLPQPTVLRVWDLILLEGNEILLRTALAIWQVLEDRILSVRSADEFYCIMGVLTRELLEFGLVDGNSLIKAVVAIGPLTELKTLRDHYLYNINPWGASLPKAMIEKQLKLYPNKTLALDISALKKQYSKLKQRQRQAHIIFSAAISRQPPPAAPVTMNHLLLGKSALVPAKRIGPPKGAIPPARQTPSTLYWKDAPKQDSSSSSSDTELCDDESEESSDEEEAAKKRQFDDNLLSDSDNILMKNDNTTSAKTSASELEKNLEVEPDTLDIDIERSNTASQNLMTEKSEISEIGDTFDTASFNVKVSSESDDENFDFERFLADRVKCLKAHSLSEEEPDERINYARRNSEKALQIIQENSLILHRILQCQSRLTPSPPLVHPENAIPGLDDTNTRDSPLLNDYSDRISKQNEGIGSDIPSQEDVHEFDAEIDAHESYSSTQTQQKFEAKINSVEDLQSPQYGSKYTSILEKSKSLDERYNALILNIPPIKQSASEEKSIQKVFEETSGSCDVKKEENLEKYSFDKYRFVSSFSTEKGMHKKTDSTNMPELQKYQDYLKETTLKGSAFESGSPEKEDVKTPPLIIPTADEETPASYAPFEKFSYYFPSEEKKLSPSDILAVSPSLKREKSPTDDREKHPTTFTFNVEEADSAISLLDTYTSDINLSPVKSKYSLTNLTDYASEKFETEQSTPEICDLSNKYLQTFRQVSLTDYDENFSSDKNLTSEPDSKTCYSFLQSSPDKQCEIISRVNSQDNSCSYRSKESIEKISPTETQFNIESPTKTWISSPEDNKIFDDIKRLEEPNRKSLTLDISAYGESSKSKSPVKSPLKSPMRSPNKAFNPFPVPLSTRQSKEVPIKLGLYKK